MKLQLDLVDLSGQPRNGIFESQADADKWLADHVDEFGENPQVTTTDLTAQDDQEKKVLTRSQVREACLDVIDQIAAVNQDGGATDDQMDAFFTTDPTREIVLALLAGSPKTASRLITKVGPSLYPQAVVDSILAQLAPLIK